MHDKLNKHVCTVVIIVRCERNHIKSFGWQSQVLIANAHDQHFNIIALVVTMGYDQYKIVCVPLVSISGNYGQLSLENAIYYLYIQ